jgi:hypothetical protein
MTQPTSTVPPPSAPTFNPAPPPPLDTDPICRQLRTIVHLLTLILLVAASSFGWTLYRHNEIVRCATEQAQSAPQQAACLATN